MRVGDIANAEKHIIKSLEIREQVLGKDNLETAYSYHNLGRIYEFTGNYYKAEKLYQQSMNIRKKKLGPEAGIVGTNLSDLGTLYKKMGELHKAESYFKKAQIALNIAYRKHDPGSLISTNDLNLASLYFSMNRPDEAFEIIKKYNPPQGIGAYLLAKKNYQGAISEFEKSLMISIRSGSKRSMGVDNIGLGLSYEGLGNYNKAEYHFKNAIDIFEEQWKLLTFERKKNFLKADIGLSFKRYDAYEGIIRVIFKQKSKGYEEEMFSYVERLKSRTLLEMLSGKRSENFSIADKAVLDKDSSFQRQIAILQAKADSNEKLITTMREYEQFINEVKLSNIELASLITIEASTIKTVQSIIDDSTTVLEYFIANDATYAWLITKNNIIVNEIRYGENRMNYLINELLIPNISKNTRAIKVTPWNSENEIQVIDTNEEKRLLNRKNFLSNVIEIYNILIKPIEELIQTKRLVIVPYGVLHKLPFPALHNGDEFMIDKYELCVVPSSSTFEYIYKKKSIINNRYIAFANPETKYISLEFAEEEVQNSMKIFNEKTIYFRSDASESQVKRISHNAGIVHFACHGTFNEQYPMQSALLLAKDIENDGYLQVHEIFGLDLKGTDLVVLSACDTAISKIFGGDDLVGLSRGFIYAGAKSILSTLWEVDDMSTSIFINEFYKNWQINKMDKAAAIRKAQIYVKSLPNYNHPFYWASFILIGSWN